jgi:radical SAM modification target selenobiotic family peptide
MKKKMKKMLAGLGIAGLLGAGSIAAPGAMAASGSG